MIYLVEDDKSIRELLVYTLNNSGLPANGFEKPSEFYRELRADDADLIILDIMLPECDGLTMLKNLRADEKTKHIPVMMLTAKGSEYDKVVGLDMGADDYMTKPFSVSELLARVEALVRRVGRQGASSAAPEPDGRMVSGVFVLDQKSRVLYKNGTPIDLTQVEFQIMELFFANPGVALVREKILEGVWGENYFGDVKIVDVNIRRLRMKIEDEPSAPKHILTVWGYGYRWNA